MLARFAVGGRLPGQDRLGSAVGIQTVGLALLAPLRRPGPVHLDDLDPCAGDRGRNPDAVAAGALDPDRRQRAVLDQPCDRPPVARDRGGELPVSHRPPERSDDRDVDRVLVRVDTADSVLWVCHDGAALPDPMGRHRPDRSDRTYTRPRDGPGSY